MAQSLRHLCGMGNGAAEKGRGNQMRRSVTDGQPVYRTPHLTASTTAAQPVNPSWIVSSGLLWNLQTFQIFLLYTFLCLVFWKGSKMLYPYFRHFLKKKKSFGGIIPVCSFSWNVWCRLREVWRFGFLLLLLFLKEGKKKDGFRFGIMTSSPRLHNF